MKINFNKGELKKQRDALERYEKFLPPLQLKKQQLQFEILEQANLLNAQRQILQKKKEALKSWAGLLTEAKEELRKWLSPIKIITETKNIAGISLPVFQKLEFAPAEYDLFIMPLWLDFAVEVYRDALGVIYHIETLKKGIEILKQELRLTTQRVNLFEKVKIPEAKENIRRIKIYLGDQQVNAVCRSKIAKRKIEEAALVGVRE